MSAQKWTDPIFAMEDGTPPTAAAPVEKRRSLFPKQVERELEKRTARDELKREIAQLRLIRNGKVDSLGKRAADLLKRLKP